MRVMVFRDFRDFSDEWYRNGMLFTFSRAPESCSSGEMIISLLLRAVIRLLHVHCGGRGLWKAMICWCLMQ